MSGFDWITPEPAFDFEALHAQFDTLLMGRRTYEIVRGMGQSRAYPSGMILLEYEVQHAGEGEA